LLAAVGRLLVLYILLFQDPRDFGSWDSRRRRNSGNINATGNLKLSLGETSHGCRAQ
jgi:hypothetical protein